jgi:predicted GNAT family acetyltransferase
VESDFRDNSAISRFEMPIGDGALAVAYYKVEDGRVILFHTEVPQELSGLGYGSRLAH